MSLCFVLFLSRHLKQDSVPLTFFVQTDEKTEGTFIKMFSFVFHIRKKVMEDWNDKRVTCPSTIERQ